MPSRKSLCVVFLFLFALAPVLVRAQTASSALVTGTVYDPSQAVVPGATVELRDKATNITLTQATNALGTYTFATVLAGTYKVTVTAQGFRTTVIPELRVAVAQSYTVNVTLEVGTTTQTVEVQATVAVELQKTDATVGDVIGGDELKYLPTPNRQVSGLLLLQPLVMPLTAGQDTGTGGQVAGARSDQTVFLLDGGDATSDTEGSGGYNTQFAGEIRPIIPVPAESIEEFRVGTTNPNATFGRSQGAQVAMVTKRGTNNVHGSAYWYHQNDNLNANSWDLNASGIKRPELKDNRYGGTLGGPILKDRLWLFGHYEGRRFPQTTTRTKVVPTATLRQGILQYKDASGTIIQYNMNLTNGPISTACVGGNCDPRNRGASSVVLADLNQLPAGTPGASGGDGLNLVGWRGVITTGIRSEFGVARADYKINDKWNFFGTGRYYWYTQPGLQQVDIVGISGCKAPCSTRVNPLQPRYYSAGVNGQLKPNLLSETRFSWYRHWWEWATKAPFPQVSGTAAPLSLAGEGTGNTGSIKIADPINIDTQNARSRVWNGKDTFIGENLTWLKGKHNWEFGGSYRFENIFHKRTDKVTGGLTTSPIFYTGATFVSIPDANRPTACSTTVTTNCLKSSDKNRWNQQYATLLGIVDKAAQILTRDGNLNPQALGTPFSAQVHIHAVEGYFQDIFKLTNSFTLTYGVTYQVQRPPTEASGRQMVPVFADTQAPVKLSDYFNSRATAAAQGNIVNPDISYVPINHLIGQRFVSNVDWDNFGPRIAGAWNPSFSNFFFGNRKTVIRAGYSVTFTRMNGVGLVMTPILGVGLGNVQACLAPQFNIATPCVTSSSTDPTNAFRVGVDGTGSNILPSTLAVAPAQIPFPVGKPYKETRSFMINPGFQPGRSHSFDLTWQRELPYNLLVEFGYVGRLGRNLVQNADVNSTPFMFLDKVSGQTLGAAFDAVAQQLRAGTSPSAVTPQPWFENIVGAGTTRSLASRFSFDFQVGSLAAIMQSTAGRCVPGSTGCVAGSGGGVDIRLFDLGRQPIDNIQTQISNYTSDRGTSDYHAGFASLHKRFSQGLTFDFNYTYSHSIDLFGLNQENTQFSYTSPYNRSLDREPSLWDARHVLNFHWYYELPFGRGKRYSTSNSILDKVMGGWHVAGIWTYRTGLPLCPFGGGDDWLGGGANYGAPNAAACLVPISAGFRPTATPHFGVNGDPTTGAGTNADPANGGNSLNIFSSSDLVKVFNNYRYPLITQDGRFGFGHIHGLGNWNIDMSIGKRTTIRERYSVTFTADFLNAFNHVVFGDPTLDITDPASFGVLTGQFGNPRFIQLGLRIEF